MDSHGPRSTWPCGTQCSTLLRETLDVISPKWATPVLVALQEAPRALRYAELEAIAYGITPKELARNLKNFEAAGLISRTVHPTVPPSVEYALTELGRSLGPTLQALADWAALHGDKVAENRAAFMR